MRNASNTCATCGQPVPEQELNTADPLEAFIADNLPTPSAVFCGDACYQCRPSAYRKKYDA